VSDLDAVGERLAGGDSLSSPAQCRPQLDQRSRVLQPAGRRRQQLYRFVQPLNL
jgi:hypothetical protein